jgi:hypothetical protein
LKVDRAYDKQNQHFEQWHVPVNPRTYLVTNDTKVGALERAKYHWRNGGSPTDQYGSDSVLVLTAADKSKPARYQAFLKLIQVPKKQVFAASTLKEKPRTGLGGSMGANVSIMKLGERGYGGYYREREMVWKDAGKADGFLANETYYYLPLKGFEIQSTGAGVGDVKRFLDRIKNAGLGLENIVLYGVRKSDHKWVASQPNWINIQEQLVKSFGNIDLVNLRKQIAKGLDLKRYYRYNSDIATKVNADSPYLKFVEEFKDAPTASFGLDSFNSLARDYKGTVDVDAIVTGIQDELTAVKNRYPLLSSLRDYDIDSDAVAQYINLIDKEV